MGSAMGWCDYKGEKELRRSSPNSPPHDGVGTVDCLKLLVTLWSDSPKL